MRSPLPDLDHAIADVRRSLPYGSPILAIPSVRSRDFVEVLQGVLIPAGLASARFCVDWYGDYIDSERATVRVLDGVLGRAHIGALLPVLEEASRAQADLLIAATDIDPHVLGMLLVNSIKGTLRSLPLTPVGDGAGDAIGAIARASAATPGAAHAAGLTVGAPGALARVIATTGGTVLAGAHPGARPIGVVYVGGDDIAHARARAQAARLGPAGLA